VTTREHEPPSTYLHALEAAHALGRADGHLAVDIEPDGEPAAVGPYCHGLAADDFARLVWGAGSTTVPAGVRLNAPLWYGHGFREALASARAQQPGRGAAGAGTAEQVSRWPTQRQAPSALARREPWTAPNHAVRPLGDAGPEGRAAA
jgi:hypothetical protein